jgi:uncharacterized protein (DUF2164 family)
MYEPNPNSPFLQRFVGDLPDYLRNEEIRIIAVHEDNLAPYVSLQIGNSDYVIVHEIRSRKTRVLQGEHEILSESHSPEIFKDFIAEVLKRG